MFEGYLVVEAVFNAQQSPVFGEILFGLVGCDKGVPAGYPAVAKTGIAEVEFSVFVVIFLQGAVCPAGG
ncbi:hypothetical protein SPSYN_03155 [Sporotomaculum syntrophicum]|uniref:Uncharacterized protein n=1 Tax=Sporotomaculum syntrophicum TaxID=182264 RepID=A0A9D3AXJ1_9FIRM|nr:hypothetical protein SPSYN_03155 [Sporotomaculum syntrophicum]